MGDELEDAVGVVNDYEIKTPILVDPGLPSILRFIVFLGAKRWVMEVLLKESDLFEESLANCRGSVFESLGHCIAVLDRRRARLDFLSTVRAFSSLLRGAIISPAVLKGP
jgi:hypothetical protein